MNGPDLEALGGLPRNFLRPCLLLLVAESPSHGYDLLDQMRSFGLIGVDPGGLYRALRCLERGDLVSSTWESSPNGPSRRTYRITAEGLDWLHAWAGSLRESGRILAAFLNRYEAQAGAATRRGRSLGG